MYLKCPLLNSNLHFKMLTEFGYGCKKNCRTLNFEQLLFLEIFELLHKFGSNLALKTNGNSVITVNSVHRLSYMPDDLLWCSSRACGRPWLRAGVEKATTCLPLASLAAL